MDALAEYFRMHFDSDINAANLVEGLHCSSSSHKVSHQVAQYSVKSTHYHTSRNMKPMKLLQVFDAVLDSILAIQIHQVDLS